MESLHGQPQYISCVWRRNQLKFEHSKNESHLRNAQHFQNSNKNYKIWAIFYQTRLLNDITLHFLTTFIFRAYIQMAGEWHANFRFYNQRFILKLLFVSHLQMATFRLKLTHALGIFTLLAFFFIDSFNWLPQTKISFRDFTGFFFISKKKKICQKRFFLHSRYTERKHTAIVQICKLFRTFTFNLNSASLL